MSPRPRVLVVEDDPLVLMMLTLELQEDGFDVDGVETAGEARLHMGAAGYWLDALVCDLDLRDGADGYRLAHGARTLNPKAAVLFTSGVAQPDFAALRVEGAGLAPKPAIPQEIARRLRRLLA